MPMIEWGRNMDYETSKEILHTATEGMKAVGPFAAILLVAGGIFGLHKNMDDAERRPRDLALRRARRMRRELFTPPPQINPRLEIATDGD